ncbi:ATP synthase subunit I [Spiribacter vilamensis]|uniref:ATP synthase protein I n=1 Tax=Spiribacter vilamensis TaxID=531306 RepID=A0A4Q8D2H0_9GAMM|nr:ATP synthase subunit I [Spiribacter vilamensis]RZU99532.1 ATP synthase protein I [Spiribacter vilamensis]TVO61498.1 hypothetical protein FPL09_05105 [Spiribacter vilamensis]
MSLRRVALRVIRIQMAIGLAAAAIWTLSSGIGAGLAAVSGAGISAFMTFYVAARWRLRSAAETDPKVILGTFYRAQMMKLLLGSVLIVTAVYAFRDEAAALVTTLALTLVAYGLVLLGDID